MGQAYLSRGKTPLNLQTKIVNKSGIFFSEDDNCDGYNQVISRTQAEDGSYIRLLGENITVIVGEMQEVDVNV